MERFAKEIAVVECFTFLEEADRKWEFLKLAVEEQLEIGEGVYSVIAAEHAEDIQSQLLVFLNTARTSASWYEPFKKKEIRERGLRSL